MDDPTDLVRRGYDAVSDLYRADNADPARYRPWIDELLTMLEPSSRVLDVGCGCGIPVARDLAAAGHAVTGVDVSPVQVHRARRLVPRGRFLCADATELELPARSFDAVVALYSVFHMPLPTQPALLRSMAHWLEDDGVLLLVAGWREWTGTEENWLGGPAPMWWTHGDAETYRRWLEDAGFRVVRQGLVPEGRGGHSLFWAVSPSAR